MSETNAPEASVLKIDRVQLEESARASREDRTSLLVDHVAFTKDGTQATDGCALLQIPYPEECEPRERFILPRDFVFALSRLAPDALAEAGSSFPQRPIAMGVEDHQVSACGATFERVQSPRRFPDVEGLIAQTTDGEPTARIDVDPRRLATLLLALANVIDARHVCPKAVTLELSENAGCIVLRAPGAPGTVAVLMTVSVHGKDAS